MRPITVWFWLQRKRLQKKFEFLIDLATAAIVAEDTKPTQNKPHLVKKGLNHSDPESQRTWQESIQRSKKHEKTTGMANEMKNYIVLPKI